MKQLRLKERLLDYNGIIVAWSAGSMNCADFDDSVGHEIIALNDGSYILIDDEQTTLYGEAYMIKDRQQTQIYKDGESIAL